MALSFGEHEGKCMKDLPIDYIVWLSGHRLVLCGCEPALPSQALFALFTFHPTVVQEAKVYLQDKCWHCGIVFPQCEKVKIELGEDSDPRCEWAYLNLHMNCIQEISTTKVYDQLSSPDTMELLGKAITNFAKTRHTATRFPTMTSII